MKIAKDTLTHIDNEDDRVYLKSKAFPVNIRLYHSNPDYRTIVDKCCNMIRVYALATFSDYKKPHGMSGANLAIPFNIIGVVLDRGTTSEQVLIMINPVIVESKGSFISKSNCGSIRLKDPIKVERSEYIKVEYFNTLGHKRTKEFLSTYYGGTVQHEIDHNNGILILDREIK